MQQLEIIFLLDLAGTAVFAYSGSLAAQRQGFHAIGVFYIALLTAVGGGTLRTILLQTDGLFWLDSGAYGVVVILTILLSYLIRIRTDSLAFYVVDSLSLAVFTAIGVTVALEHNYSIFVAIGMGTLTGIGGGLIRDAITSQHPQALSDPVYPLLMMAGVIGSVLGIYLTGQAWPLSCAMVLMVVLISVFSRKHVPPVVSEQQSTSHRTRTTNVLRGQQAPEVEPNVTAARTAIKVFSILLTTALGLYIVYSNLNMAASNVTDQSSQVASTELFDRQVAQTRMHLRNEDALNANKIIKEIELYNPQHPVLATLKNDHLTLQKFLANIQNTSSAIQKGSFEKARVSLESASKYKPNSETVLTLKQQLKEQVEKRGLEKKNLALAKTNMQLHIKNAELHLINGSLNSAAAEIKMADDYAIFSPALVRLHAIIQQKREFRNRPLNDSELDYATQQFHTLQRAIELKNMRAIRQLTIGNGKKQDMFEYFFERYVDIDIRLSGITVEGKSALATIHLDKMQLPDGNINFPPSSYAVIGLSLNHSEQGWGKINW